MSTASRATISIFVAIVALTVGVGSGATIAEPGTPMRTMLEFPALFLIWGALIAFMVFLIVWVAEAMASEKPTMSDEQAPQPDVIDFPRRGQHAA